MSKDDLMENGLVVLEVLEVLGGEASFGEVRALVRAQLRRDVRPVLYSLLERGLVLRYSQGRYAMTREGRAALRPFTSAA